MSGTLPIGLYLEKYNNSPFIFVNQNMHNEIDIQKLYILYIHLIKYLTLFGWLKI